MKRIIIAAILSITAVGCSSQANSRYAVVDGKRVPVSSTGDSNVVYEAITIGDSRFVKIGQNLWCHVKYGNQYGGFENKRADYYDYNFTVFPILDAEGKPAKCEVE